MFEMIMGPVHPQVYMAMVIARICHKGDMWNEEGFFDTHVVPTVERVRDDDRCDEQCLCIAFLMNIPNLTDVSMEELHVLGIDHHAIAAIDLLVQGEEEEWVDYTLRIAEFPMLRIVKLHELRERLLKTPDKEDAHEQYTRAISILEGYHDDYNRPEHEAHPSLN